MLWELDGRTADEKGTAFPVCRDPTHLHPFLFLGMLWELDGRTADEKGTAFPVCHGETSGETFLADAACVIRDDFMARDAENLNFNITAFCKLD